jgi:hypothetical protein
MTTPGTRATERAKPPPSLRGRRTAAVAIVAFVSLGGCDAAPRTSTASAAASVTLDASAVHVLGTSRSIAVVRDLEVLPDGRVWVINSVEPFFVGIDPAGDVIDEHGMRGGGPEEFGLPLGFVAGGIDGEAWVFDGVRHSLIEVSRPESPWSETRLPVADVPRGSVIGGRDLTDNRVRLARLDDAILVPRTNGSMDDGIFAFWLAIWGADLLAFETAVDSVRQLISLREVLGDPTATLDREVDLPFPIWFRLWAVCGDRVRVYNRPGNQVRAFARDGSELEPTALPPVALERVTQRQFARAVLGLLMAERLGRTGGNVTAEDSVRLLNEVVSEARGEPEQLALYLPRYTDLRCAPDGTLWLRPFDLDVGGLKGGPAWLRITPAGDTQEIRLPDRFDAYRFTADRIWGVQRDELDVATVAWIAVPPAR